MKRLLVTGSRHFNDGFSARDALRTAWMDLSAKEFGEEVVLVHGGAPGADTLAHNIWTQHGGPHIEVHPADWEQYGKAAGPIRNQEMVALGADLCLAFFDEHPNRGTHHCVSLAEAAGIPVRRIQKEGT